tara:strand:+ start:4508 stop:4837 length:330 start_codon:yes stop_codon:yes gene_type:complete
MGHIREGKRGGHLQPRNHPWKKLFKPRNPNQNIGSLENWESPKQPEKSLFSQGDLFVEGRTSVIELKKVLGVGTYTQRSHSDVVSITYLQNLSPDLFTEAANNILRGEW